MCSCGWRFAIGCQKIQYTRAFQYARYPHTTIREHYYDIYLRVLALRELSSIGLVPVHQLGLHLDVGVPLDVGLHCVAHLLDGHAHLADRLLRATHRVAHHIERLQPPPALVLRAQIM